LPIDTATEMARKLCAGLAAAHDKGVLHRDLKPANIMIDGRGQVLITDFGLAGIANKIQSSEIRHGTPAYMAPEQLTGKEVTTRSDIYALGLVLYEMYTGKRAYEAATLAEMTRLRQETTPTVVAHVKDIDPSVERIIKRCLDPDPQQRPPTAIAVALALPGGDPLAAALAAGETPSPELVASASEHDALKPLVALGCLAAIVACLIAIPFLGSQSAWIAKTPFDTPKDALAQKAREMIRQFGYTDRPVDTANGLHYASDYLTDLNQHGKSASTLSHLNTGQPAPIHFWYRTSPRYMIAAQLGDDGTVKPDDPVMDVSGMVKIELDPQGHLLAFDAVPPQVDSSPPSNKTLDGNALLTVAGLDPARFQPADPQWTPLAICDQRAAWTGTFTGDSNPLRVEAASWRGKLVYFSLISPWDRAERMERAPTTSSQRILLVVAITLLCGVVIAACLLARHNIRMGRGDWQNALRLSGLLFFLSMGSWALVAHHMPTVGELFILAMGLETSALVSGMIWLLYVALEPFVRRHWPRTIISSTRLLRGGWRDPVVGGHMLIGILYGTVTTVLVELIAFLNLQHTGVPANFIQLSTIQSISEVAGALATVLPSSILSTLGTFFILFVFRVIFRREWLAAAAFVVFFAVVSTLATASSGFVAAPLRTLQFVLMMFVMLRFGLFPFVVGSCIANVLVVFPITADFSAWYAGSAIFSLVCIVALAGWAFHSALGGRPLFKSELLDG